MVAFEKSILPLIEARLGQMTPNEAKIAQYFLRDCVANDPLSARAVAARLDVSEASLTRFAQKCGFEGYRAFAYTYQPPRTKQHSSDFIEPVLASYRDLLMKTYSIIDMTQIRRITRLMTEQKRIYFYGKGSSGMVAREMKLRFMRIGLICEAITDDDLIRINKVILDDDCLVIGVSISGKTRIIIEALKSAKRSGAKTILLTANHDSSFADYCDEIQLFAVKNQLEQGRLISPQFPALVVLDIIYADVMRTHTEQRDATWQRTWQALHLDKE